ncbi:hypothetical protein V8B97DRAFT_1534356 [Scleroderma yunnanense]
MIMVIIVTWVVVVVVMSSTLMGSLVTTVNIQMVMAVFSAGEWLLSCRVVAVVVMPLVLVVGHPGGCCHCCHDACKSKH